ncbi:hypothetical protein J1N35_022570 [Gossypium stocksii]|uniref:Uncharacterized protein n=1 Tax=Gossypium stocksii TaxID=47602 RepID=A0A9D4A3L3_9ROSI|nr:hypothetical protein J1N35_022570 [Gossypium stocksii]
MTTLMGYFVDVVDNEANLDQNSQIEMVFKSMSKDFVGFRASYNIGNKNPTLTQLMKELQSYKLILNSDQPVQRAEVKIVVTFSSKGKGNRTKKGKAKVSSSP